MSRLSLQSGRRDRMEPPTERPRSTCIWTIRQDGRTFPFSLGAATQ
jgi:hypothetical protein